MTSARVPLALAAACAALAGLVIVAFAVGRFPVSVGDLLGVLWSKLAGTEHGLDPTIETVVLKVRGPRVAGAILIGAALAAAVPRTRTCSATRWCRRIFSACRPARRWARCSAFSCRST